MWIRFEGTVDLYGAPIGAAVVDTDVVMGVYEDVLTKDDKFVCNAITVEYGMSRAVYIPNTTLAIVLERLKISVEV